MLTSEDDRCCLGALCVLHALVKNSGKHSQLERNNTWFRFKGTKEKTKQLTWMRIMFSGVIFVAMSVFLRLMPSFSMFSLFLRQRPIENFLKQQTCSLSV